jgi:hypothetical protein
MSFRALWAFENLILFFLLGEKTIQLKLNRKAYWPWLGGVLLIFGSVGFIADSLVNHASEPAGMNNVNPGAAQASTAGQGFAHSIPAGHTGKAAEHNHESNSAIADKPVKFNTEKQQKLVYSSLLRRIDKNSAREQADKLSMPDWDKIINPYGYFIDNVDENGMVGSNGIPDYIDLYRGVDADFFQDNISNGVATDMSALLPGPRLQDEVLYNGAVRPEHDLGNAYVLATIGTDNHLRLYAGVERLLTDAPTYIEIEFNQNPVRLGTGAPWPIVGQRVDGDLLVRMAFANQALQSVQLEQWRKGGFSVVKTGSGIAIGSCQQTRELMYCTGLPPIRQPEEGVEVWDENSNQLEPTSPDNFVEVGIDIDLLLNQDADITSVLFRTPEDIAMNNFGVFERLAQLDKPINSKTGLTK